MEISPEGYLHIADHETFRKEILNAESGKSIFDYNALLMMNKELDCFNALITT